MTHHIVAADDLRFRYPDGFEALQGLSFNIHHGESVAVVGANGAGKSTLLMHLNGYLLPQSGQVRIGDDILCAETIDAVRKTVGMVFQDPDDQLFMPTVYEDVAFGPVNLGLSPEEVEGRVKSALADVACLDLAERPPHNLSAGEKRSVAIATVLAMEPKILVLDEPSTNLDPWSRRHLINLLETFNHTKIIASHDLDMVLELCERMIVLRQGRVMADGPTRELFADKELLRESRLECPPSLTAR